MEDNDDSGRSGTTAENLPKLDRTNLWDRSYNLLKQMIIRREFPAGGKLSLPELSQQLGVSRTPIRDALNRLEMEGLVRTVPKVGTFVSAIDGGMIEDIMSTRMMIEFWVADLLPTLPKEKVLGITEEMKAILASSAKLIRSRRFAAHALADNNVKFHLAFVALGKNNFNLDIYGKAMNYRSIAVQYHLISKEMVETAHTQHENIIKAVRTQDPERVKKIVRLHLMDSQDRLIGNITRGGGVV